MSTTPANNLTSSESVQNLEIIKNIAIAAKVAAHQFDILIAELDQVWTSDFAIFDFESEDQAKRAEGLLCEIFGKSDPAMVGKIIEEFQRYVEQTLRPLFQSLRNIEMKLPENDPTIKKVKIHQRKLEKLKSQAAELADDLKRQGERKSWKNVSGAWIKLDLFLAETVRFRKGFAEQELKWNEKAGIKPIGTAYTTLTDKPHIGPVGRTECKVRVEIRLFSRLYSNTVHNWFDRFSRDSADFNDPACVYPMAVAIADCNFFSPHKELFTNCLPVGCDLLDDDKFHPDRVLKIEKEFERICADCKGVFEEFDKQILALGPPVEFWPGMKDLSNCEITLENAKPDSREAAEYEPRPKLENCKARFENDFTLALIFHRKNGDPHRLAIQPELRSLLKLIIDSGGSIPRAELCKKLRQKESDNYQPEKLLLSTTAQTLITARLLGADRNGRTSVYWAKAKV